MLLISRRARAGGRADHHVHVAVVVDVAERRAAADVVQRERRAGPRGHVLEPAVAQVAIQLIRHLQRKRIVGPRLRLDDRDAAVDGQQIEPRVVVVVEPGRAEAGLGQARRAEARAPPCDPRRRRRPC